MKDFGISKDFGVYASNDGVILLKHMYHNDPISFVPYATVLNVDEISLVDGEVVTDMNSSSQKALFHRARVGAATSFCQGPLLALQPGEYEATFRLKTVNASSDHIATLGVHRFPIELEVTTTGTEHTGRKFYFSMKYSNQTVVHASRNLSRNDFSVFGTYEEFSLTFSLDVPAALTISITDVTPDADLYLDWVSVIQLNGFP
jgi:hypothetical protein